MPGHDSQETVPVEKALSRVITEREELKEKLGQAQDQIDGMSVMLQYATEFTLRYDEREVITVQTRSYEEDSFAVVNAFGEVLDKEGNWIYEPRPSERDDELIANTRRPMVGALIAAVEFVQKQIEGSGQ